MLPGRLERKTRHLKCGAAPPKSAVEVEFVTLFNRRTFPGRCAGSSTSPTSVLSSPPLCERSRSNRSSSSAAKNVLFSERSRYCGKFNLYSPPKDPWRFSEPKGVSLIQQRPHYPSSWKNSIVLTARQFAGKENLPQAVRLEAPCCVREADNGLCRSPRTEPRLEHAHRH